MFKRLGKIVVALGGVVVLAAVPFWIYLQTPVTPARPKITIEHGASLRQIGRRLEEQGVIRYSLLFLIYAQLTGKAGQLKAGDYLFEGPTTPKEVLKKLTEGKVLFVKVPIIEGKTIEEIAKSFNNLSDLKNPNFKEEWLVLSQDPNFTRSLELRAPTLEGYLFPNTYHLTAEARPSEFLKLLVKEFQKNYQQLLGGLKNTPNLFQHEVVTLASLIEKEAGDDAERPVIASVFLNRLAKKMPLQSDPTIIYGLKNFDGNIRKEDISNPHPYNTYVHAGLPPGPICNPGLPSLKAALSPAQTDYLYFVSKRDGTHHFSKTAEEHAEAVRKYQLQQ